MKTISTLAIAICGLLIFISCKKDKTTTPEIKEVQVRVANATSWTFYNCTVDPTGTLSDNPGPNAFNYGQINIDTNSDYHGFPKVYNYSWVRLTMNNRTYYLKFFDYTGETPLANGRYTYKITYSATNDRLNYELIKD
ncbi:MAG: hypothetical protein JWQ27_45 [Ferruginibacter sp.]|nr:hypothetical protein [Ferruginibacter sp.]